MEIRRAGREDLEGIKRLLTQVNLIHHKGRPDLFKEARKYTDDELLAIFEDDDRPVFVAVSGSEVEGYAFCILQEHKNEPMLADCRTLYIDDLCVEENKRGEHIGSRLYRFVLEYASSIGCYNVTLNVWECNPEAHHFYEAMGMKVQKYGMETIVGAQGTK